MASRIVENDALAYELILPAVERLLTNVNAYEPLWRDGWKNLADAITSFERGKSQVRECADSKISVVTLAPEVFNGSVPFTAISKFAHGELFLIGIPTKGGWLYRVDYPYYSWAETVVRPRILHRDLTEALQLLNERETNRDGGRWKTDHREMTSAVKFLDETGSLTVSRLQPDEVVKALAGIKEQSAGHQVQTPCTT